MRLNSIRIRTMLVFIVLGILIILVFGGIELLNAQQGIKHDTEVYDLQDSHYLANYVSMYMNNITSNANLVSTSPDTIGALELSNMSHLKEIADNLNRDIPRTSIVYFEDNDGNLLYSTIPMNSSYRSSDWHSKIIQNNTDYVTEFYYNNALNDHVLTVLYPVIENNTVLGRLITVIRPNALQDSIQSQIINPNENVLVFDSKGLLIAHDNGTFLNRGADLSPYHEVQKAMLGKEGVEVSSDTWDRQSRISAFYPTPELGWGVIVSTPTSAVYSPLKNEVFLMAYMLILIIIGLIAAGYFFSNYLTSPIIRLSDTIQKISTGDHMVRTNEKRDDEIGDLARTFNDMMDKLEHTEKISEDAKAQAELYVDLMGHDIINMNQVALGYLELAHNVIDGGDTIGKDEQELIDKPIESISNSSKLIDNVRKIQKIRSGDVEPELIDLNELLKDLADRSRSVREREININYHSDIGCKVIASDLLADVFSNLIGNAIKHSRGPLNIDIGLTKIQEQGMDYCKITVSDNGPGIPDDKKKVLFSRFTRGSTKAKGTGLGLYLVKALVENFKGRVWVEDRVPGNYTQGSKFTVLLPSQ